MSLLFGTRAVAIFDLSNLVARSTAVAGEFYLNNTCHMLLKQRKNLPGHHFVFALEGKGTAARQKLCPKYKAQRRPNPLFIAARRDVIRLLHHVAGTLVKAPKGEADDAIATYVQQRCGGAEVRIVSNDRDLWQLITQHVIVQAVVKGTPTTVDTYRCRRLFGAPPEAIPLAKAMLGDSSDEIPRAVGRVKKEKLLRLATEAQRAAKLEAVTRRASYLTAPEKKKILAAVNLVKQQEKLTRSWDQLQLQVKECPGSVASFKRYIRHQNVKLTETEITTIVGSNFREV